MSAGVRQLLMKMRPVASDVFVIVPSLQSWNTTSRGVLIWYIVPIEMHP